MPDTRSPCGRIEGASARSARKAVGDGGASERDLRVRRPDVAHLSQADAPTTCKCFARFAQQAAPRTSTVASSAQKHVPASSGRSSMSGSRHGTPRAPQITVESHVSISVSNSLDIHIGPMPGRTDRSACTGVIEQA